MTTITNILKTHICEDIFQNGYPCRVDNKNPYDYFMEADVDSTEIPEDTELLSSFEPAEEYIIENVRTLRGLMQAKLDDLERLQESIFANCTVVHQIGKDEFASDSDFHDFADVRGVTLHRSGTADEYVTFRVLDTQGGEV